MITRWRPPVGEGLRVDSFVCEGAVIPPFYDSMVAKLIVAGKSRDEVLDKSIAALQRFEIVGIKTTREFHLEVLQHPHFRSASIHTRWVDEYQRKPDV